MRTWCVRFSGLILAPFLLAVSLGAQPLPPADAAEILVTLNKLTVLGSVLHIAAHPDDENTAFLAYCSKGRFLRSAYLSVTRGEGGQNLIGPEQGEFLGVLRTQELLVARRIDGAEQYFTSAIDFGYSKSAEEALRIWDRRAILSDMVWIIRQFRPDVVVTRFTPTLGTHGHHTASAILAQEAFEAAGDPRQFPEQLQSVGPWKPVRLVFNHSAFFGVPADTAGAVAIDLGGYDPLLGRSFTEISGLGRSMHKSQGFGALQNRGANIQYFLHTAGDRARGDLFDGIDLTWNRVRGGAAVGAILQRARSSFRPEDPSAILPLLLEAYRELATLEPDPWTALKRRELTEAIRLCAGIWVDALSLEPSVTPGGSVAVTVSALSRSRLPVRLDRIATSAGFDTSLQLRLTSNVNVTIPLRFSAPEETPLSQPYWLRDRQEPGRYRLSDPAALLRAENAPVATVDILLAVAETPVTFTLPVQYRWVDPVEGELYRPLAVAPPIALSFTEPITLFTSGAPKEVSVRLRSAAAGARGELRLQLPEGWSADPAAAPFELGTTGEERKVTFSVTPGRSAGGLVTAVAEIGRRSWTRGESILRYPHITAQTLFPMAEGRVMRIDLRRGKEKIGYIMGSGDEVPAALRRMGYAVTLLGDEELATLPLSSFDAIIAGVRSANTRPALRLQKGRLMEYVRGGGTYLMQYVTPRAKESDDLGPAPLGISRERVSVEDAPVTILDAASPLLTRPHAIGEEDFAGWVQERGLSFADRWDSAYRPVLAMNDPGEPARAGGLLIAPYGKGIFLYTGLSFFRQLPEGVAGAYRLFANLVEARGEDFP